MLSLRGGDVGFLHRAAKDGGAERGNYVVRASTALFQMTWFTILKKVAGTGAGDQYWRVSKLRGGKILGL